MSQKLNPKIESTQPNFTKCNIPFLLMQIQGLREKLANNTFTQTKKSKTKETANVIDRVLELIGRLRDNEKALNEKSPNTSEQQNVGIDR